MIRTIKLWSRKTTLQLFDSNYDFKFSKGLIAQQLCCVYTDPSNIMN